MTSAQTPTQPRLMPWWQRILPECGGHTADAYGPAGAIGFGAPSAVMYLSYTPA